MGAASWSAQVLAQLFLRIVAAPLARDLAVRVPRDIAVGYCRAKQAARFIRSAIAHTAQQVSVLVADQAAAFSRTAEVAVGVHTAVASSAVDLSEIVADAVAGEDGRKNSKGQSPGCNETSDHGISNGF